MSHAEVLSEFGIPVRTQKAGGRAGELEILGNQRSRRMWRSKVLAWLDSRKAPTVRGVDDVDMERRMRRLGRGSK